MIRSDFIEFYIFHTFFFIAFLFDSASYIVQTIIFLYQEIKKKILRGYTRKFVTNAGLLVCS